MLQALNTGHEGSLVTVHANSADDAIHRLETLATMSDLNLPFEALRDQINNAIDVIVQIDRFADGRRRLAEVAVVASNRREPFRLAPVATFAADPIGPDRRVTGRFVHTRLPETVGAPADARRRGGAAGVRRRGGPRGRRRARGALMERDAQALLLLVAVLRRRARRHRALRERRRAARGARVARRARRRGPRLAAASCARSTRGCGGPSAGVGWRRGCRAARSGSRRPSSCSAGRARGVRVLPGADAVPAALDGAARGRGRRGLRRTRLGREAPRHAQRRSSSPSSPTSRGCWPTARPPACRSRRRSSSPRASSTTRPRPSCGP